MPSQPDRTMRKCPGCGNFFPADPNKISQCPACGRLVLFDDSSRRVAFERGNLANAENQAAVEQPQPTEPGLKARTSKRPAVIGPLLARQAARWLPYQTAIERQLIDVWPARLFTFTKHERWALRASRRGQFGFTQLLDPRLAKYLASGSEPVRLNTLSSLSLQIAQQLARSQSSLYLGSITALDTTTAAALARHRGETLGLDGLTALPDELATTLVRHRGEGLSLGGLSRIEPGTATILAEYPGRLAINGISSLTPAVATELAGHRGKSLSLAGIRQLGPETATALARYEGDLYLEGLAEITGELAQAFQDFTGKLQLKFHEIRRRRRRQPQREEVSTSFSLFFLLVIATGLVIAGYELFVFLTELIGSI